ncbi:amylo-alpha-1,6-glucosidase [Photobacterium sp. S4TG1]|uniref:amylo-alpha-1,6-glucosidase n=1 Tax=Photobacterium sp. S4TG1 TaxID=3114587 RepID=UPI002E17A52E|nr:amylo-alpha-1,6-glucosidase [Photobacterium sp. S4TG1]
MSILLDNNLYLKGTFNGWGNDTQFKKVTDGTYQAYLMLLPLQYRFKISDINGSEEFSFTADSIKEVECKLDRPIHLLSAKGIGNDITINIKSLACYCFEVIVSDNVFSLEVKMSLNKYIRSDLSRNLLSESFPINACSTEIKKKQHWVLASTSLFSELAINNRTTCPFIFGDNIDGYYEGHSYSFIGNKYNHKQGWIVGGFASFINKKLNNKINAIDADIFPYGVTHYYDTEYKNSCNDTVMLFSATKTQQRCIALSIKSEYPAILSIAPQLNINFSESVVSTFNNGAVYKVSSDYSQNKLPKFIAICADKSFIFEESDDSLHSELIETALFDRRQVIPIISSQNLESQITVYITFADSEADAISAANRMLAHDGKTQHKQAVYDVLTNTYLWTSDIEYNRALMWSKLSGRVFVSTEYGHGIWAGLPWFKDCWGRDTFIALPGISLVNGFMDEAKNIINRFSQWQMTDSDHCHYGRIPNRVTSFDEMIYNTTDGTPWMIRGIWDYLRYSGDRGFAITIYPVVQTYIAGVEKYYLDDLGLMTHRDPDTWMDAKLLGLYPWSSRGNRANDIQVLWYTSLQVAIKLADINGDMDSKRHYQQLADRVKQNFTPLFWELESHQLADCIKADGQRDMKVRPNQLLAVTIPYEQDFIDREIGAYVVSNTVSELLFPWGITSLSQYDPQFHPYHDNQQQYHKDAAYHNGTIWGWNAGFTVTALTLYGYDDFAYSLTKNLVDQILYHGHRGTMSENLDAFLDHKQNITLSGTYAQAWSVSEFTRNGFQDYLGYQPNLIEGIITLCPSLPSKWHNFHAEIKVGVSHRLLIDFKSNSKGEQCYVLTMLEQNNLSLVLQFTADDKSKYQAILPVSSQKMELIFNPSLVQLFFDGVEYKLEKIQSSYQAWIGQLSFTKPDLNIRHQVLQTQHWLQRQVKQQESINTDA